LEEKKADEISEKEGERREEGVVGNTKAKIAGQVDSQYKPMGSEPANREDKQGEKKINMEERAKAKEEQKEGATGVTCSSRERSSGPGPLEVEGKIEEA